MGKLLNMFLSMKSMGIMLLIFAFSIGAATFIENDFGTKSAKALIYNAKWFEFLLFLLAVNLTANIFTYRLYKKEKMPLLLFHLSFLVILIGSGVTRYIGYEGSMHIREGESVNTITSEKSFVTLTIKNGGNSKTFEKEVLLSPLTNNTSKDTFTLDGENYTVELTDYIPNVAKILEEKPEGKPIVSLVASSQKGGREDVVLSAGESVRIDDKKLCFGTDDCSVKIVEKEGALYIQNSGKIEILSMDSGESGVAEAGLVPLQERFLYRLEGISLVLRDFKQKGVLTYKSVGGANKEAFPDMLRFKINIGKDAGELEVFGSAGSIGKSYTFDSGTKKVEIVYGAKEITLPFSLKLNTFELKRYPGSMSPSSYASYVSVEDAAAKENFDYKIYMNHILDYKGFRFYQASFDRDELGTILSVNHDYYGTLITYIGYVMMGIGMFWALFAKRGRVAHLYKKTQNIANSLLFAAAFGILSISPQTALAQDFSGEEIIKTITSVDSSHATKFGELFVQDGGGRVKPIDSLAHDILNKIHRSDEVYGLHPNQVLLGMITRPAMWQKVKLIAINNPEVKKLIGIQANEKYAAFSDFFDFSGPQSYKLANAIEEAGRKKPSQQNKFDKEILKVDERLNISYMIFTGDLLRILPQENDPNFKWFGPMEAFSTFSESQAKEAQTLIVDYFKNVDVGIDKGEWTGANIALDKLKKFQEKYGKEVLPSDAKAKAEIFYGNYQIFKKLFPVYGLVGLVLLIFSIYNIIKPIQIISKVKTASLIILGVAFLVHTCTLGLRWYISGHAPWSDSYESMIYIAWATMVAGFIFVRNSNIALAGTAILASITLFVAHLSWMDPQITNIVPVLNSYWLVIHVSMITASYGFLGLGAILAFITLLLMATKSQNSAIRINKSIEELTYVNEMALTVGLVLLTIGNFLGGVWANESWGRYWGWDPKETWALVTILVYAFVVHMRFIPSLRGVFAFNVASLLAFASVIMTYFGVNFYLSGLHSYAKGDPIPVPTFVYVSIVIVLLVIALAYRKKEKKSSI